MLYSKLYIFLTELIANDQNFYQLIATIKARLIKRLQMYTYGTVNSIFVEIQSNTSNIKNATHRKSELIS